MTLSQREKLLASIVGVLVAGLALWLGFRLFSGPLVLVRAQVAAYQNKLDTLQDQVLRAKKAQDRVAQWNRQALPSDAARAGALYQSWLLELAGKANFRQKKVDPGEVRNQSSAYRVLPFTVRGQATLEELIRFLFDFYSAGHLHQIRRITIRPVEKSKDLDVVLAIEALSLPTADRKDQLSQEKGQRLKLRDLAEYRKAIAERNVLAPYRPPPPVRPPEPPIVANLPKPEPFDPSRFAYVTGIVEVNGEPQVWVKARTTDENFQLRQGDKFQLGPFSAVVARIDSRNVEIEVDGKRHTVPLGSNIRGVPVNSEKPESRGDGGNSPNPGMDRREGGEREPTRPGERENGNSVGMRVVDPRASASALLPPPGNGNKAPNGEGPFSKRGRRSRELRGSQDRGGEP